MSPASSFQRYKKLSEALRPMMGTEGHRTQHGRQCLRIPGCERWNECEKRFSRGWRRAKRESSCRTTGDGRRCDQNL